MKKMSKGMLMTALICGAVYLGGSPVYASELQEFSLDEYVVTAARTETKLVDTPANISVVDAQTIEERHYQDVSEVLKDVPGANVMDNGGGAYEKAVILNGDSRVLILVDGRKVEIASGTSSGRASFDMNLLPDVNLIERIEVLKGAAGALYGSDAVGGVINIITKKADSSYGKVAVSKGSMGTEDYNAMYSIKEGKTGITVSASKYEQDYFKYKDVNSNTTKRWTEGSSIDSEKVSLKVKQELSKATNFEIGYDYSKYEGLSSGDLYNFCGISDVKKELNSIYAKIDWIINDNDQGYLNISKSEYDYKSVAASNKYYPIGYLYGDINEKTFNLDLQQVINTSDYNKLIAGLSYRESDILNIADREDLDENWNRIGITENGNKYDESIKNKAIFINDSWEISPKWTLNAGVRYDDHSRSGDETTLSAGLNKKFNDNSHAYINWGEVFKSPTVGDLYSPMGGNSKLKAETGKSWTIGYSTMFNDNTNIAVNYFQSDLENAIIWNQSLNNGNGMMDNVAKQEKRGMELLLNHKLNDNVDLNASYTYVNVKNDNNDDRGLLKDWNSMPNIYRLGINYHDGKWNSNLWLRAGTGAATHTFINSSGRPAIAYVDNNYITIDATVSYQANKDLKLFIKGYNLFNEAYAEMGGIDMYGGSYKYPAQSRRFIVGAEYKF